MIGLLCPGQGAQDIVIVERLCSDERGQAVFALFRQVTGVSADELARGPRERLFDNAIAQPLVCAIALAAHAALEARMPSVRVIAGYSIGELAAYGCAGALSPFDTLHLARIRAEFMEAASKSPAGMVAVRGLRRQDALILCRDYDVHIAIRNGVDRFVIAGNRENIDSFVPAAAARGAAITPLPVRIPSHTPLLAKAAEQFHEVLSAASFKEPAVPVIAGIDGSPVLSKERAIATLSRQICETVDWEACMTGLAESGASTFLEIGAGRDLSRMLRDTHPRMAARSIDEFHSLAGVIAWLAR